MRAIALEKVRSSLERWGRYSTALVWLALATLWTLAQFRVVSYIVTSDPKLYLELARVLAEAPVGSAEWKAACTHISPLWPGLLALVWRLIGPAAPYWLNWGLGLGWLIALRGLAVRRWGDGWSAALVLAAVPAVVLNAHPLELEWLLHPYREMTTTLALTAAWATLADSPVAISRWFMAGVWSLLATAAREPTLLALAGPAMLAMTLRPLKVWARGVRLLALATPLLAALVLWWLTRSVSGLHAWTHQFHGFWYEVFEMGRWRRAGLNLHELGVMFVRGLGMVGIIGAILGWGWCARRRDGVGWMTAAAVALTIPFYAAYLAAPRYLTVAWVASGWMAAEGWASVAAWLERRYPALRTWLTWSAMMGALMSVGLAAVREAPITLGPRFGWRETRQAAAAVDETATGKPVYVERDCRVVESLVLHHGRSPLRWPETTELAGPASGAVFLQPMNRACFTDARVQRGGARVEEWLRQFGRLCPVIDGACHATLQLGAGRYRLCRFTSWADAVPSFAEGALAWPNDAVVLWIDLRSAPVKRWSFRWSEDNQTGETTIVWHGVESGLHPLLVSPALCGRVGRWRLDADGPVPSDPIALIQQGDHAVRFELGPHRRLSVLRWFEPPFVVSRLAERHGVALRTEGRLRLPAPIRAEAAEGRLKVDLELAPMGTFTGTTVVVRGEEGELGRVDIHRRRRVIEWTSTITCTSSFTATVDCTPDLSGTGFLRLEAVRITVLGPPFTKVK